MEKYIYNEQNGLWYGVAGRIIIFLVWSYPLKKKKGISEYGDSAFTLYPRA